jgi:hypothetical protein
MTFRTKIAMVLGVAVLIVPVTETASAGATAKQIKLKGVLTGHKEVGGVQTSIVAVTEGKKKVGKLLVGEGSCTSSGSQCSRTGTANLKVGKIKSKARLRLNWNSHGCSINGCTHPAKYATGKITQGSKAEAIRVNTPSIENGQPFTILLG